MWEQRGSSGPCSICWATGASSSTSGWSSCRWDSGTIPWHRSHEPRAAQNGCQGGSPHLVVGARLATHTDRGHVKRLGVPAFPSNPEAPRICDISQSSAWIAVPGQGEGAVIARVSGFHSIPPPFSTLLSGYRSALHSPFLQGGSSVLRLMSEHFPTPSWLSRSLDPSRQSCRIPSIHVHPNPSR